MTFSGLLPRLDRPLDGVWSFSVQIDFVGGRLHVAGRLDHRTAHVFTDAIRTLVSGDAEAWRIDVAGLTDCDPTGLRAIGAGYRLALRHGRHLTLVGAPPWLHQALARLRLDHHVLDSSTVGAPTVADRVSA